jgi:hypothetical protein
MSAKNHGGQRSSITRDVTEKEIFEELQRINTAFNGVASYFKHVSPPANEREQGRRDRIVRIAREMTLAAMSVRLKKTAPNIYRAVLLEGTKYTEEKIQNRDVNFAITIPKRPPTFARFLARASIPVVFQVILRRLRTRWKATPKVIILGDHYVDRAGRYGELQHRGNLRWQQTIHYRTQAVLRVASIIEKGADRFVNPLGGVLSVQTYPTLTPSQARQLVLKLKTPVRVTHALLGFYQRMTPRQLKELIRESKKQPPAAAR